MSLSLPSWAAVYEYLVVIWAYISALFSILLTVLSYILVVRESKILITLSFFTTFRQSIIESATVVRSGQSFTVWEIVGKVGGTVATDLQNWILNSFPRISEGLGHLITFIQTPGLMQKLGSLSLLSKSFIGVWDGVSSIVLWMAMYRLIVGKGMESDISWYETVQWFLILVFIVIVFGNFDFSVLVDRVAFLADTIAQFVDKYVSTNSTLNETGNVTRELVSNSTNTTPG